ncbi:hypothetical protein HDU93_003650 [Gonapodya sp. JEL0774]|nr:hypothetical protein HDU93_003650 [Gonapodya sp. JEL0774]
MVSGDLGLVGAFAQELSGVTTSSVSNSGSTQTDRDQDWDLDGHTPPRRTLPTTGAPGPGPAASSAHLAPVVEAEGAMYIGYGYDDERVANARFITVLSQAGSSGYPHSAISSAMVISVPLTTLQAPESAIQVDVQGMEGPMSILMELPRVEMILLIDTLFSN